MPQYYGSCQRIGRGKISWNFQVFFLPDRPVRTHAADTSFEIENGEAHLDVSFTDDSLNVIQTTIYGSDESGPRMPDDFRPLGKWLRKSRPSLGRFDQFPRPLSDFIDRFDLLVGMASDITPDTPEEEIGRRLRDLLESPIPTKTPVADQPALVPARQP